MKPYLGILIDSFWEAVSSKVLWALLALSTFILLALAPFGLTTERSFKFANYDINGAEKSRLLEKLGRGLDGKGSLGIQAISQKLNTKIQERIRKKVEDPKSNEDIRTREIVEELNRLLRDKTLYSAEAFPSTGQIDRYKALIDKLPDQIADDELEELNRRLLFATFPVELNPARGEQIWVAYAGFKIGGALPLTRKQIRQFFEPVVLMTVLKLGLAVFIDFIGIIMTSWIIPDTFRSGSLHLMLSKPISRTWLFLSKFFGGCIFVSLNLVYVIVGLYFIAGLRFDIWNHGLLACIPLLLFVFVIFYSISALTGLVWGNAIVCVVSCIVFWGFCFSIGLVREMMHDPVERSQLINRITEIDGHVLTVHESGQLSVWNNEHSIWQPATDVRSSFGSRSLTFGPIHDAERQQFLTKSFVQSSPFDPTGNSGQRNIVLVDLSEHKQPAGDESSPEETSEVSREPVDLAKLRETGFWTTENGPEIPPQVSNILQVGDAVVAVCRSGLFRLDLDHKPSAETNKLTDAMRKWLPGGGANNEDGPFKRVSPEDFTVTDNTTVAATQSGDGILAYTSGKLSLLRYKDEAFELLAETKLEGEGSEAAIVAANGSYCLVARQEMPVEVFDAALQPLGQIELAKGQTPKQWSWIPEAPNQLSLVTQEGAVLRLDCSAKSAQRLKLATSAKITCINWKNEQEAYVGVAPNRVLLVNVKDQSILQDYSPQLRTFEKVYNWVVNPLYKINPKPAAMDDAMAYLLTGKTTFDENLVTVKLDNSKRELAVWQPIASNSAFVLIILIICCIYVSRKEY
jgi:ABC-type transport system involved in multi-copper enzyme maturation permease subunit